MSWERRVSHADRIVWAHTETGVRVEAMRFGGPVETMTGSEPDGRATWSLVVRPPRKMGDAAIEQLATQHTGTTKQMAINQAETWMHKHDDGCPTTYNERSVAGWHDMEVSTNQ